MGNKHKEQQIEETEQFYSPSNVFNSNLTQYTPFYSNFYYFCQWMAKFNFYINFIPKENDITHLVIMKNGPNDFNVFKIIKAIDKLKVKNFEDFNYNELLIIKNELTEDVDNVEENINLHNKELIERLYNILTQVYHIFPIKYQKILLRGPPNNHRWICWLTAAKINYKITSRKDLMKENYDIFNYLNNKNLKRKYKRLITNDINNSFMFFTPEKLRMLYNILKALTLYFNTIEYIPGTDKIAGYLYLISDFNENETFLLLRYLYSPYYGLKYREFLIENSPLLNLYCFTNHQLIKDRFPKVFQKIKKMNVDRDLWYGKWFQFLFVQSFIFPIVTRFIDCIFGFGLDFLYNLSLSFVKNFEEKLLSSIDSNEFLNIFQLTLSLDDDIVKFREKIIKYANGINIKETLLEKIKKKYYQTEYCDSDYFFETYKEICEADKLNNEEYKMIENILEEISLNNSENSKEKNEEENEEEEEENKKNQSEENEEEDENEESEESENESENENEENEENESFESLEIQSEHQPIKISNMIKEKDSFDSNEINTDTNLTEQKNSFRLINSIHKDESIDFPSFDESESD